MASLPDRLSVIAPRMREEIYVHADVDEADRFGRVLSSFTPRLIVNQVRTPDEVKMGFAVRSVCRKYFGLDLDYAGYVNYDDCVWRSIKERRPLVLAPPYP